MTNNDTKPKSDPSSSMPIKLSVHRSAGAAKILNEEETQMLIKWIWAEMQIHHDKNLFRFPKMGVCIVRDGSDLVILTDDEHRNALKEEKKE